jgi:hypothetical protein
MAKSNMFDKRAIVERHTAQREYLEAAQAQNTYEYSVSFADGRQFAASTSAMPSLTPLRFKQLRPGVVHRGRKIEGTLVTHPFQMTATIMVLQDDDDPDSAVLVRFAPTWPAPGPTTNLLSFT